MLWEVVQIGPSCVIYYKLVCYHVECNSHDMVDKLLLLGSVKMKGVWMQFLKWYAGFDLDDLRETIARRFVFSVMFPALPKGYCIHNWAIDR